MELVKYIHPQSKNDHEKDESIFRDIQHAAVASVSGKSPFFSENGSTAEPSFVFGLEIKRNKIPPMPKIWLVH